MEVLRAENLIKIYGNSVSDNGTKALSGVDLSIQEGEFIAIMGPSGSGKSTLVSILSGIMKPSSGRVQIGGVYLNEMNADEMAVFRRNKLGFVFQEFNLLDNLTIEENIMLPMVLDKLPQEEMKRRTQEVLKLFEIEKIKDKYPANVSGGQQQRTAVSRALVNTPYIVFADEPTGNLDSKSANAVMGCLEKMNVERKTTVLMVTHDVFAASFCRKVIFIRDGKVSLEVTRKGDRKEFFDKILDCQAIMGGADNDI